MIGLDTNLLVYAHRAATARHEDAKKALERAVHDGRGWGVALPVLAEFWAVATHPLAEGRPSTPAEARAFLEALEDAGCRLWLPGEGFWSRLARLAADLAVGGARIFDLQIALICFDHGASELWTHDRSFAVVPGLRRVDPLLDR